MSISSQSKAFQSALLQIERSDLDLEKTKELTFDLFDSAGQFQFSFQLNDLLKKVFQYKRVETAKNIIDALCLLSIQKDFEPTQINWLEYFKFLSQLSTMDYCVESVMRMFEQKIYLPEFTMNFIIEKLIEDRHFEQSLKVLNQLHENGRIEKLNHREILKNFLLFNQSESAFQFLQLLPLATTSTLYIWEDYIQYCCKKDHLQEARKLIRKHFATVLPSNVNEIESIYSKFLSNICKCERVLDVLTETLDDIIELKLKIQPSVLKDTLLKLLDEKIEQKEFYLRVDTLKFALGSREFSALLSRLIQLKRKIEVMALIDLIVNENSFTFKLFDLNLTNQEMKYILSAQSLSIRCLINEKEKFEALNDEKSVTSILDRLTFEEIDDCDSSFEKVV